MRFRSGMIFALAAAVGLGGCAASTASAPAPGGNTPNELTSSTGKVYPPGTRPTETPQSRAGTIAIARSQFQEAMTHAQAGIAASPGNPVHYYIGGEAAAGLGNYTLADSLWIIAERIYPAYERDIEPTRDQYWTKAFNEGNQAYNMGNIPAAIEAWRKADLIYRLRPEAAQNLGIGLTQQQQYADAIRVYTRALENLSLVPATWVIDEMERVARAESKAVIQDNLIQLLLFTNAFAQAEPILREAVRERPTELDLQANLAATLAALNRNAEATEIYNRILATPNVPPAQLFNIGVALFGAREPVRAAEAFGRVTRIQPNNRDAWFNQANALYEAARSVTDPTQATARWSELITVATGHVQIDPLSETAHLILAAAYRETMRNNDALAALTKSEQLPVHLEDLTIAPSASNTTVTGKVIGNTAPSGTQLRLRFTFYNDAGEVGTQVATVSAPAKDAEAPLEVRFNQVATAYKYELMP